MNYMGRNHYAQVRHEQVMFEGDNYSPSKWVSKMAGNTARNAWRDIWIRLPGSSQWTFANDLRRAGS
jgi:hypothetical protein